MKKSTLLLPLCIWMLSGCDNDPGEGKPSAEVAAPVEQALAEDDATEAAPAPADSKSFVFSNEGSSLAFVGAKVTRKHDGSFKTFQGTIDTPVSDPTKGTVKVEVDIASLEADDPKLTGHLKSPDLLDAGKFPKATFESTSIKAGGSDGATHEITGNLTLHGETKSITFPATISVSDTEAQAKASFTIDRQQFSITYPGMPDDLIKDEVLLTFDIKATPKSE